VQPCVRVGLILVAAVSVCAPVALVFWQSFLDGPFFAHNVHLSLGAFEYIFQDPRFYASFGNSLLLAVGMTVVAVPLGALLAFFIVRTDLPGRRWLEPLILTPMFISSIVLGFGFVVALGPVGIVSLEVKRLLGLVPWNLYSKTSLVVLAGLTHVPHVFVYSASALRGLGSDVEEAARSAGASPLRTAWTVSLPMIAPSLLYAAVLVFFLGFELFGLPLILADPQNISVLATYVYSLTNVLGVPSYQLMAVVVLVIVTITLPLVFLQRRLLRHANRYVSVRGKASAQRLLHIGSWRWPAVTLVWAWLAIAVIIPVCGLVLRAFLSRWGEGIEIAGALTLQNFRELGNFPNVIRAIVNTLVLGVVGGAASMAVYVMLNLAAHRWQSRWTTLMDYVVLLPRAMPGIVAGLTIFWLFLFVSPLQPLRQTLFSLWIAYTLVWMAYGMRLVSAALLQIAPELEEAGRVVGASAARVNRDLTVPLIRASLVGCWLLLFVTFVREYSTGVYLLGPGTEVIGSLLVSLWATGGVDLVVALSTVNVVIVGGGLLFIARYGRKLQHG
jgi:iron(III) transport system permease protein